MDLRDRIDRRRRGEREKRLVRDYDALNPAVHPDEPTGRGPTLERLLDLVEPAFDGDLPPTAYVWGPKGSGKSACLSALFSALAQRSRQARSTILTTTRAERPPPTSYVYVDARDATSEFALYRSVLDALVEESVPAHGVGTDELRSRLETHVRPRGRVVVAVDHVDEPETYPPSTVADAFASLDHAVTWFAVGQTPPADVDVDPTETVAFQAYERHALVDVVTERASVGLTRHALAHEQVREVAGWADGDAHDALAAVFGAADRATVAGRDRIDETDLEVGMDAVPWGCISLGRVLALSETRQRVLRALLDLAPDERSSVTAATEAIAASSAIDLSPSTVKRMLYELAEAGVVRRVTTPSDGGLGRPPSRVEPQFPTRVFRRLFALNHEVGT